MMPNSPVSTFLGWIALMGGVWFLFEKSESVASPDTRLRITRWLKALEPEQVVSSWPDTFLSIFDSVFGARHLSWRCFSRSCVASCCVVATIGFVWAVFHWKTLHLALMFGEDDAFLPFMLLSLISLLVVTTALNLIPDYLSLLKTRYIIQQMRGLRSRGRIVALFALDLFATGCLAIGAYIGLMSGAVAIAKATGHQAYFGHVLALVLDIVRTGNLGYIHIWSPSREVTTITLETGIPIAIWFWAAFFTSLWAGLYVLTSAAVSLSHTLGIGVAAVRYFLDIEKKPLTSLGYVAMLFVSIAYWTYWMVAVIQHHGP